MGLAERWGQMPFHFWSVVWFGLGAVVGSFLNVCIHRLPRGESLVTPPSHCPHCQERIPWFLNIPLASWLSLRGRCGFCGAPIAARYFLVELLTGLLFLGAWLAYGEKSPALALVYCVALAGLVTATFIDLEHLMIPDGLTLGGAATGFLASLLVPELHRTTNLGDALRSCLFGAGLGAAVIYAIVRLGKLALGRQRLSLAPQSRIYFTEEHLVLPDQQIPYGELFYRRSDAIVFEAERLELVDRGYARVTVRLTQDKLTIGAEEFAPEAVPWMEVVTDELVVPREAMGLGDVKFMAAIGAFCGWTGVLWALLISAFLGSVVGVTLIALRRHARSNPIPYGPYLAVATAVWIFCGDRVLKWWLGNW